ncbi:hypothetical protein [Bacillus atrophaeus]|uniref:hypothetical protein n=1 Tax=Bacillus atrophaeus TaxID=1452 RepID=UPI002E248006|nr:hypothetical protein [Bacillus atrophaeus]
MDKTLLHEMITELYARTKAGGLARQERMEEITALSDAYFDSTGEHPEPVALERMANLVLFEELSDSHPDKVTREENPIMSDEQVARRKEGKHRKKSNNPRIEVPLSIGQNVGSDGRNHSYPTKRQRSERESAFVDKAAMARNKGRRRQYRKFINGKSDGQFTVNIATGEIIYH